MYVNEASWIAFWVFMGGLWVFTSIAEWKKDRDD